MSPCTHVQNVMTSYCGSILHTAFTLHSLGKFNKKSLEGCLSSTWHRNGGGLKFLGGAHPPPAPSSLSWPYIQPRCMLNRASLNKNIFLCHVKCIECLQVGPGVLWGGAWIAGSWSHSWDSGQWAPALPTRHSQCCSDSAPASAHALWY